LVRDGKHHVSALHLEFYRTSDGEFQAGEVACRSGGGLIKETIRRTYGIDQAWATALLGVGLLPEEISASALVPRPECPPTVKDHGAERHWCLPRQPGIRDA
ncbi:MAG: hypothetical protein ACHQCE_21070, partial [Streptosporangiales bacterium]